MPHLPLSRRAVTRALLTAPAAMIIVRADRAGAFPTTTGDARWDAAMNSLARAEEAYRAFARDVMDPLGAEADRLFGEKRWHGQTYARFQKWERYEEYCQAGKRVDELCEPFIKAEAVVYDTPAPNLKALLWKLERSLDDTDNGDVAYHADAILADCRRLLSEP